MIKTNVEKFKNVKIFKNYYLSLKIKLMLQVNEKFGKIAYNSKKNKS
jgi:hypothetical protein